MPRPRRRRHGPNPDRRRALGLLAASYDGCTEAIMRAHGFTIEQILRASYGGLTMASLVGRPVRRA
jgi:hypothetical protein